MELVNVRLDENDGFVVILDQTRLPDEIVYEKIKTKESAFEAIKMLKVRGAPCIGIFAGMCMYSLGRMLSESDFISELKALGEYLNSARPTAVNLSWAVGRMIKKAEENAQKSKAEISEILKKEAISIYDEDVMMCKKISEYGLSLVKDGDGILTHCNAGPLATSKYGTGLGPIILGLEKGMEFHCYVDETRPLLQGARITALELKNTGADVTLICDNMASIVMKEGRINAVFVGCDRVAKNGDTANKIGTSGVAVLAKYYGVPFYVFCPSSTVDFNCKTGDDIKIELRDGEEIRTMHYKKAVAPEVKCYNPSFDVTDNSLITAIVTEKGICYPPFEKSLYDALVNLH